MDAGFIIIVLLLSFFGLMTFVAPAMKFFKWSTKGKNWEESETSIPVIF